MTDHAKPLAVLSASAPRRFFGTAALAAIGVLMLYVAAFQPPQNPIGLVLLIPGGMIFLWQSNKLFNATRNGLILTRDGLFDSAGIEICRIDNIERVDRGFFAFKPSNGFLIQLNAPMQRAWVPGLWWRMGRRIGIGGTTPGRAAREMADMIALLITDLGKEALLRQDDENLS